MKNILLSLVVMITLSTFIVAEQNIVLMDTQEEAEGYEDRDAGLYLGLSYTHLSHDADRIDKTTVSEMDYVALSLQAGYKFNPYIAIEGRYGTTFGEPWQVKGLYPVGDSDITVLSIYLKPIVPIGPEFDLYALFGYASTEVNGVFTNDMSFSIDDISFSWGVGGIYDITEELSVFIDYTVFYDDVPFIYDSVVDSFNYGLTYRF